MAYKLLVLAALLPAALAGPAQDKNTCKSNNKCLSALNSPHRIEIAQAFCNVFTDVPCKNSKVIPKFVLEGCNGKDVIAAVSSACGCLPTTPVTSSASCVASTATIVNTQTVWSTSTQTSVQTVSNTIYSTETISNTIYSTNTVSNTETVYITVPQTITATATETTTYLQTFEAPNTLIISTTSKTASTSAATATLAALPKSCSNAQVSCQNTTAVADLCCFNGPGGQLLLTQFWDTAPSTGPADSWTLHGLWPDHCDGTYDANCDASREYTNITQILQSYSQNDLLTYMNTYWKDYQGNDESFWEHEWGKHGTCISTLETKCYDNYTPQAEVVNYFQKAVELFKGLDSYKVLAAAGIVPSTTATYTLAQIQAALTAAHGFPVTVGCASSALDEIWYHYNVRGSVVSGTFIPTSPDGSKSSCPSTGISYLPKYPTATATATSSGAIATSTATATPYSGKGYLQAYTSGTNTGCLISAGTWYTTGTCATYTATASGSGFTLTSSKGPCAILSDNSFNCASGNAAAVFTAVNGLLAYAGSSAFYAAAVAAGSVQQKVYTTTAAVGVTFQWGTIPA